MLEPNYDAFLSFSGADRQPGRELAAELRTAGLKVFLDEDGIEPFTGITDGVRGALRASKVLIAYYSVDYSTRPACQFELMMAFLAGQQEGDPCGRILVINPEPGTDHLRPIELADARFAPAASGIATIARQVVKRVAEVDWSIGEVRSVKRPRWSAQRLGHARNFIGRYRELWDLHTALHTTDYPLISEAACGPFASVCGLPGAGKTALVTNYAQRFAAAFPGGIHWVSLKGSDPDADSLRGHYTRELRRVGFEIGADVETIRDDRVADTVARYLQNSQSSLWVIDDVPSGVDAAMLDLLLLPEDSGARTVLVSDDNVFGDLISVVRLGPLPMVDAAALLNTYRPPDGVAERNARDDVVAALGSNAATLVAIGKYLRDGQGLLSYASLKGELDVVGSVGGAILARVGRLLDRLGPDELTLLHLASRCGTELLPARFLASLPSLAAIDIDAALKRMLSYCVASRVDAVWRLDTLVIRAARYCRAYHSTCEVSVSEISDALARLNCTSEMSAPEREILHHMAHGVTRSIDGSRLTQLSPRLATNG